MTLQHIPHWFMMLYVAAVGACVGSFLGVVISRLPQEKSIVRPRSFCDTCKTPIPWYDNIPVLSYLLLRGTCRTCRSHIPARALVLEIATAFLFVALWMRFGFVADLGLWMPVAAALLAIVFLDIDHWWIPDVITYPAIVYAFAFSFFPKGLSPVDALLGIWPAVLVFCVAWLFSKIMGREGLGFGDIKLLVLIGLCVGPHQALTVLLLAAIQGTIIGVIVLATGGHKDQSQCTTDSNSKRPTSDLDANVSDVSPMDQNLDDNEEVWTPPPRAIPFGPFLVLATYEVVLLPEIFAHAAPKIAIRLLELFA